MTRWMHDTTAECNGCGSQTYESDHWDARVTGARPISCPNGHSRVPEPENCEGGGLHGGMQRLRLRNGYGWVTSHVLQEAMVPLL